jgi:hypothetical protein
MSSFSPRLSIRTVTRLVRSLSPIEFDEVTGGGGTTLTVTGTGPLPPSGFQLGIPSTYFDVETTATFVGAVEVCIDYSGISFANESGLTLFHEEGGNIVDITTVLNTANDVICCSTTASLATFAIFERLIEVAIDLKPGSNPSTVNLGSQGVTPLAVFGSAEFDATRIDIASLEINGQAATVAVKGKGRELINFGDLNNDGFIDASIKFDTEGLELADNAPLTLTGALIDGIPFTGEQPAGDPVNIVP